MNDAVLPTKSAGIRTTRLPYQSEMCPAKQETHDGAHGVKLRRRS